MALTDDQLYKLIDNVNSYHRLVSESKGELLLNKYPNAAAAYSLRLLDGYYRDPLVRVKDEDGREVDVYADYNNELSLDSLVSTVSDADETTTTPDTDGDGDPTFNLGLQSLGEFVHDDAYDSVNEAVTATVCVWYDQANENDAKQVVATSQPKIYDSVTGSIGSLRFDGSDDYLQTAYDNANNYTAFWAQTPTSGGLGQVIGRGDLASRHVAGWNNGNYVFHYRGGSVDIQAPGAAAKYLGYVLSQPSSANCRVGYNGSTGTTSAVIGTGTLENMVIGAERAGLLLYGQSDIHEIIIYPSDQSTNRSDIEEDINSFYQIDGYTPTPKLIDLTQDLAVQNGGTIADGTPAAAYSLRLLSSTYNGPLVRIRRTIDNTEVDVYPDSDGEFSIYSTIQDGGTELTTGVTGGSTDKTTLHEFLYGQDTDCTVVRWYDQASGNHATQDVATSQPKIYDSLTGMVTENNKPAVQSIGDVSFLTHTNVLRGHNHGLFAVCGPSTEWGSPWQSGLTIRGSTLLRADVSGQVIQFNMPNMFSNQQILTTIADGTEIRAYRNAIESTTGAITFTGSTSDLNRIFDSYDDGKIQEFVFYQSDQTSNRTAVEANINQHYNIY